MHHATVVGFLVLEAAEVLKIGFSPDKLLARTKFLKICDLFLGSVVENMLKRFVFCNNYLIFVERERERRDV